MSLVRSLRYCRQESMYACEYRPATKINLEWLLCLHTCASVCCLAELCKTTVPQMDYLASHGTIDSERRTIGNSSANFILE